MSVSLIFRIVTVLILSLTQLDGEGLRIRLGELELAQQFGRELSCPGKQCRQLPEPLLGALSTEAPNDGLGKGSIVIRMNS